MRQRCAWNSSKRDTEVQGMDKKSVLLCWKQLTSLLPTVLALRCIEEQELAYNFFIIILAELVNPSVAI